jgi:5'-deoxynucleotidase YfbR-like HD superfamily hydrolase
MPDRKLDFFGPPPEPALPHLPDPAAGLAPGLPQYAYRTYTGKMLDFSRPSDADIDAEDIAHALARVCRYGGAMDGFYSVASHCVYVSRFLEEQGHSTYIQAAGLLHDATEAYLGDMVSGLKRLVPEYRRLEDAWEARVFKHFDVYVTGRVKHIVKDADLRARLSEIRDLFREYPYPRELLLGGEGDRQPCAAPVVEQTPDEAEWAWLARARALGLVT